MNAKNITGDKDRFTEATLLPGRFPREPLVIFLFFKEMYVWDPKLASGIAINLFQNVQTF